ncbi:MAG TPA: FtsX-like permease family protein, partial [Candidatus Rifleibacterium sp.]|nr:FtsX-like permease family protein [Candidatus Rifleibacterium sp.]
LQATLISRHDIISGVFFQQNDHNVVIVDKSYADLWNLKVGSVVNIGDTLFPIIGIAGSHARTARADVYMNWPDAEATISRRLSRPLNNEANLFLIEATGAETVAVAMQKVQALIEQGITNSVVCSIPVVKFMGLSQNSVNAVMLIVAVLAVLFAANAQWSAASERAHEVAILKAIGWRDRSIFAQFIVESLLISLAGGVLGAGAGYAVFRTIAKTLGARIDAAYKVVDVPTTLAALIFATALAGIIAGLVPAVRAAVTRPAEVLRDL